MPEAVNPDDDLIALLALVGARNAAPARQRESEAALRALYDRTSSKLFGLAVRVVGSRDRAEDVLQEAFITIWRSAPDYRASLSPPMAWMGMIVRGRALDLLRRRACRWAPSRPGSAAGWSSCAAACPALPEVAA
jgi:RNA polymerase sigma-70 factor (ECF subfamily)